MAARTIGMFRSPVTLSALRQVEADKANDKAGELVVTNRARYIPTSYDDKPISKVSTHASQRYYWLNNRFDSRLKINLLEQRRLARKTSIDRKAFQYDESNYDLCHCETCIGRLICLLN